jgi:hypothetical protein
MGTRIKPSSSAEVKGKYPLAVGCVPAQRCFNDLTGLNPMKPYLLSGGNALRAADRACLAK